MKIGYIGLGLMGGPLARNLIRAGKEVKVFDLNEESIKRTLAVGTTGVGVKSADELADCDIVFTPILIMFKINIQKLLFSKDYT